MTYSQFNDVMTCLIAQSDCTVCYLKCYWWVGLPTNMSMTAYACCISSTLYLHNHWELDPC